MIHFIVALPAEARPLIDHYRLHDKSTYGGFRIYTGSDAALIISGPGKVAAAAATALLGGRLAPDTQVAWLNVGIAGHATLDTGQGLLAHRITDAATGRHWYPPRVFDLPIASAELLSVDAPENDYAQAVAYDMEASGYYPIATRFSTSELVQSYKVISDNRAQRADSVTAQRCTQLIAANIDEIDQLSSALVNLQRQRQGWHTTHEGIDALASRWHFTVSQRHQLANLARRWRILLPNQPLWLDTLDTQDSAARVLNSLQQHLDSQPARLDMEPHASCV